MLYGDIEKKDGEVAECSICLLAIEDDHLVRQTPCMHLFHQDCIMSWCMNKLTCPVCRNNLQQRTEASSLTTID